MSVYNGELFLKEAIESILDQTFRDYELIIINDGSTDKTYEIIESYGDLRIKAFHFNENVGVGAALQFGLSKVTGQYVAKADADDIHHLDRLQKQVRYLDENPDVSLVKSLISYFAHDEETRSSLRFQQIKSFRENFKNRVRSKEDLREKIYWTNCVPHTTIMARTEVVQEIGYDPNLKIAEDYKLCYEINKQGYTMATIEEILVDMRISKESTTVTMGSDLWKNVFKIKQEEIRGLFNSGRVFLWGASTKGQGIVDSILPKELSVYGFLDSDVSKQGKLLSGYDIYNPNILQQGDKVIITSQPGLFEIGDNLKKRGFKSLVDFIGFF